jgi:outer membrane lipoprotein-sorting protein
MRCFLWALVVAAGSAVAPAQSTPDAPPESQLRQIDSLAGQIKDLSARFEQKKFTALLKKPLVSSGTVRAAGLAVRWDTELPEPCVLYADEKNLRLYYPDEKSEEIYPMDQRWSDLLSSPLPRLGAIEGHFTIHRAAPDELTGGLATASDRRFSLTLRLLPSDAELAKHVGQVIVVLDEKTGMARAVETTDADGDRTQMVFSDIHVNVGLNPADLELHVPPDTAVSHPMDAAPTPSSNSSP